MLTSQSPDSRCWSIDQILELLRAGANAARLDMSVGSHEDLQVRTASLGAKYYFNSISKCLDQSGIL